MNIGIFTASLLYMSGLAIAFGIMFLLDWYYNKRQIDYLAFGVVCLLTSIQTGLLFFEYHSCSFSGYLTIFKIEISIAVSSAVVFVWFLASFTHVKMRRWLIFFSVLFGTIIIYNLHSHYSILTDNSFSLKTVVLPWGESIIMSNYKVSRVAPLFFILIVSLQICYFVIFFLGRKSLNSVERPILLICLTLVFLAGVSRSFTGLLGSQALVVGPFLRLGFILFMGVLLSIRHGHQSRKLVVTNENLKHEISNRQIAEIERNKAEEALKIANSELEKRVEERTMELEKTNRQLKENQSQLIQSEKMASLGQLAAGMAHEINNPIGYVMSNLETMSKYVNVFETMLCEYERLSISVSHGDRASETAILEKIRSLELSTKAYFIREDIMNLLKESNEGASRVKEIVQGLKNFARIDEAVLKYANINDCVEDALRMVWNELKYKCHVKKELGEIPVIQCYPGQLNQVFMNLFMNAVQSISEKGEISISTSATEKEIVITISDTGIGIPKENLTRIFDPFFTTKPVGIGTGLGLAISAGIIKKHLGTINVYSVVDKGSTFTISLPVVNNLKHIRPLA